VAGGKTKYSFQSLIHQGNSSTPGKKHVLALGWFSVSIPYSSGKFINTKGV